MRAYLAAPLFTDAERAFNVSLPAALTAAGHNVYLPQREDCIKAFLAGPSA